MQQFSKTLFPSVTSFPAMSKKAAKSFSKTSAKGGIAAKPRGERSKNQLLNTISPEMDEDDAYQTAFLGKLAPYNYLWVALHRFYRTASEARNHPNSGACMDAAKKAQVILWETMASALLLRDSSFFKAIAELIPIADTPGDMGGVSPVSVWLLRFLGWRKDWLPTENGRRQFEDLFPVWPPTISELQALLKVFGVVQKSGNVIDHKDVETAAERLGFPVRAGKRGAPKRKPVK